MNIDTVTDAYLITTTDFGQTLETMIAAGNYDWTNPRITADSSPVEGTGIKSFRNKLFHFNRCIASTDVVTAIKQEGLEPATHVHGLAFGTAFPDEQRKYPIVCLGSSALVNGSRRVVCLLGLGAKRGLRLDGWDGDWYDGYRFLGVRGVSGA